MDDLVVVENLSKKFSRRDDPERAWTLLDVFLQLVHGRRTSPAPWALREVSFRIARGRMAGVVGHNGAGKSTLLRLLGGIGLPSEGRIKVQGRVGALLDLGAGFRGELTGRENAVVGGVINGLTRREVMQRFDAIVDFAGLGPFIEKPLRTYSTGMRMRLAFAVAVHSEPDILLIDEVLAVGDLAFQQKCLDRIAQFKKAGCTIILVSHDMTLVRQLCDEALWLREGHLVRHDAPRLVIDDYIDEIRTETRRRTPAEGPILRTAMDTELRVNENRLGSMELEITMVRLLQHNRSPATQVDSGDPLRVDIEYRAPKPLQSPIFTVSITREDGLICFDTNTSAAAMTIPTIQGAGKIILHMERIDLNEGVYYVDVGAYERSWSYAYDYHSQAYPLVIRSSTGTTKGVLRPPHRWEMEIARPIQGNLPERTPT